MFNIVSYTLNTPKMYSRPVNFYASLLLLSINTGYIMLTSIAGKQLTNKEIFLLALVNNKDTAGLVVYNEG